MSIPNLQKPAPTFKKIAVVKEQFKEVSLSDYKGQYVVLFFYPADFTFVCPTEIIAFSERSEDFRKLNTQVIAISCDSHYAHLAWIKTPRNLGGLQNINIPLVADKNGKIAKDYGVYDEETGISFRGVFIIDEKGILRQIIVNDLPIGRSVDEIYRLLHALKFFDKYGEVCPADWHPGAKTIKPEDNLKYFESTY